MTRIDFYIVDSDAKIIARLARLPPGGESFFPEKPDIHLYC